MNIPPMTLLMLGMGVVITLVLLAFAFSGPSAGRAQARRIEQLKTRRLGGATANIDAQLRKITANRGTKMDSFFQTLVPKPAVLKLRLNRTGKRWTVSSYAMTSIGLTVLVGGWIFFKTGNFLMALFAGAAAGLFLPHMIVGMQIGKRVKLFNVRFPDAIELMVRGLRSGLPISETLTIVASEIQEPVGSEFRGVCDRIRIGKTMDVALEDTAARIGTPEIQFFCITLEIQRETGGNLAETLSNLANVLRLRAQMKLKIRAMSSEAKASAYILGGLPFCVFGILYQANSDYMGKFFSDERLTAIGLGGAVWMGIGAFIMSQMINFEI